MSDFLPPVVLRLAADISEYTEKLALASAQLDEFTRGAGGRVDDATRTIGEGGKVAGERYSAGLGEGVKAATRTISEEGRVAGERYSTGLSQHATEGAERVTRETTGRLRDHRGRFTTEGEGHGRAHGEGFLGGVRGAFG